MLINTRHNFGILFTPKNASNSIEQMLNPYCDLKLSGSAPVRHTTFRQFRQHITPYLTQVAGVRSLSTICTIRDPRSWLFSWYRFQSRPSPQTIQSKRSTTEISYEAFVEAYLAEDKPNYAKFISQYEFVMDEAGAVGVDHIFPYERIDLLVEHFNRILDEHLELPWLNASPRSNRPSILPRRLAKKVDQIVNRWRTARGARPPAVPVPALTASLEALLEQRLERDFVLHRQILDGSQF